MLPFELTVLHAFGNYEKGAAIWAEEEVKSILNSEHALHVLKVPPKTHEAIAAEAGKVAAEPDKA